MVLVHILQPLVKILGIIHFIVGQDPGAGQVMDLGIVNVLPIRTEDVGGVVHEHCQVLAQPVIDPTENMYCCLLSCH